MKLVRPNFYDYLKIIAIITMIIDHVGFFFLPEIRELRLIGRMAFPIFLFLVGFNANYKFNRKLLTFAILLWILEIQIANLKNLDFPSLNILFSIVLARIFMSGVVRFEKYLNWLILPIFVISLIMLGISNSLFDYGTMAFLFAFWGFLTKRKHKLRWIFGIMTMLSHFVFSNSVFRFSVTHSIVLAILFVIEYVAFCYLSKGNFAIKISPKIDKILTAISNHAIEIYIIHMAIFRILSIFIY